MSAPYPIVAANFSRRVVNQNLYAPFDLETVAARLAWANNRVSGVFFVTGDVAIVIKRGHAARAGEVGVIGIVAMNLDDRKLIVHG